MTKKTKRSREDVTIHHYLDGKLQRKSVEKRVIYKLKDGTERIRYGRSYKEVVRKRGKAQSHWKAVTVKPITFSKWLQTHGSPLFWVLNE